jgi:hypothetical protein
MMKDRFVKYSSNKQETWKNRFTWKGLYGDMPKNSTSIIKFAKDGGLDDIDFQPNAIGLKNTIDKYAVKYVKWVKSKNDTYTEEEYKNMENFFIGAFGEFFFMNILQTVKCINAVSLKEGKVIRYVFDYVAPRLKGELDYGVDLTGIVSHGMDSNNCAIQVKFWNPYNEGIEMTNKVVQSVHSDALCNNFINNDETENIVICWLGNTKQVSKYLKANKHLYKHIIFIDSDALDKSINNQYLIFWDNFKEEIKNIKNNY